MSTLAFDHPRRRRTAPALVRPLVSTLAARPELLVLLALAGALNLWALDVNGWANDYYAAAVRSMTTSWHAFLYGAFDAAGLQTVDKPPLALWVQALSARAFGFNSWSLLVPQALMGVATVGLVYDLARSRFGRAAGTVAGLTLALTPITVAISRHNNPDALLVLCITAAVWALDRGLRKDGSLKWLLWSGAFVGLGFETKMAAALLVVPGHGRGVAVGRSARADGGVPAAARRRRGDGRRRARLAGARVAHAGVEPPVRLGHRRQLDLVADPRLQRPRPAVRAVAAGRGRRRVAVAAAASSAGRAGPLRLLNEALGGQAGWLIGFALVAGVALAISTRLRRNDARTGWLIAVGAAFAVTAIAFSRASGIFHPYYVAALAPFTALLVGAGYALLTRERYLGAVDAGGRRRDRGDRDRHQRDRPRLGERADRRREPDLRRGSAAGAEPAGAAGRGHRGGRHPAARPGLVVGADARARDELHVPSGWAGLGPDDGRRRSAGRRRADGRRHSPHRRGRPRAAVAAGCSAATRRPSPPR